MIREYEGKTEEEAINKAIEELHIEGEDFDVEVLDNGKRGMFKKANVRIRVKVDTGDFDENDNLFLNEEDFDETEGEEEETLEPNEELESNLCSFIDGILSHMGIEGTSSVSKRKGRKLFLNIESNSSNVIIGRKGKNLDSLQVLANVYCGKFDSERKIIVDTENYREKHEEKIIKEALRVTQQVKKTGKSMLLEPLNPYERRLVHKALNDITGIETKSEGDGLFKQIRIINRKRYY